MLRRIFPDSDLDEEQLNPSSVRVSSPHRNGVLGRPLNMRRYIAFTRNGAWLKPVAGTTQFHDDRKFVAMAIELADGSQFWVQAVWHIDGAQTQLQLTPGPDPLRAKTCISSTGADHPAWIGVTASNQFGCSVIISECNGHALTAPQMDSIAHVSRFDPWFNSLTYCTWNSLGNNLSRERIVGAVKSLNFAGIYPKCVLIDDGWQQVTGDRRLVANRPLESKFPGGLSAVVRELEGYGVDQVFVWTALCGYWLGFEASPYSMSTVDFYGSEARVPTAKDVYHYYDDFFRFLKNEGIAGAKVDVNNFLDEIEDVHFKQDLQRAYPDAVAAAATKYGLQVIFCMEQVPYILQVDSSGTALGPPLASAIRNSDDYFPHDASSHMWHVYANLYNAIYTHQFGHVLDFDMFQSRHADEGYYNDKAPSLHAAARAVCGSPINITDEVNVHNRDLIRHLTVTDEHGVPNRILRFEGAFRLGDPFHEFDSNKLVQVFNQKDSDHGVVGLFNLSHRALTELIEIPVGYIGRAFRTGQISESDESAEPDNFGEWQVLTSTIETNIEPSGWEVINLAKSRIWRGSETAVLGYIDKFVGILAVEASAWGNKLRLDLAGGGGTLGLYMNPPLKLRALIDGVESEVKQRGRYLELSIPPVCHYVEFI